MRLGLQLVGKRKLDPMALEAVVFPHEHLACSTDKVAAAMSMYAPSLGRGISIVDEFEEKGGVVLQEEVPGATAWAAAFEGNWEENHCRPGPVSPPAAVAPTRPAASGRGKASSSAAARRRRRRPKAVKNREETESQRRNHIAVERNRRRQMNDYLAVLRSAMPPSYAQRVRTCAHDASWAVHLSLCVQARAHAPGRPRPVPLSQPS